MNYDLLPTLMIVTGFGRVMAFFVTALAIHGVIRNGIQVSYVPWTARIALYFLLIALCASGMAAMFRLYGEPWAPIFRECAHGSVSFAMITVSVIVLRAQTVIDEKACEETRKAMCSMRKHAVH